MPLIVPFARFASPHTVMAGRVTPAVLTPVLAQVSENVFASASGGSLLIPQGSRLIGAYQNTGPTVSNGFRSRGGGSSSRTRRAWICRRCPAPIRADTRDLPEV
jgi:hypothetical protein